jgi:hypothetical protein
MILKLRSTMKTNAKDQSVELDEKTNPWIELVRQQVESLRFGVVQIVVHDSRVVQIERTEKVRLTGEKN